MATGAGALGKSGAERGTVCRALHPGSDLQVLEIRDDLGEQTLELFRNLRHQIHEKGDEVGETVHGTISLVGLGVGADERAIPSRFHTL